MKTKKMVQDALKHPEKWTMPELLFFRRWLDQLKVSKEKKTKRKKK